MQLSPEEILVSPSPGTSPAGGALPEAQENRHLGISSGSRSTITQASSTPHYQPCLHALSLTSRPSKQLAFFCKCHQKGVGRSYRTKTFNNLTWGSAPLSEPGVQAGAGPGSLLFEQQIYSEAQRANNSAPCWAQVDDQPCTGRG